MASAKEEEYMLQNVPNHQEQAANELNFVGNAWYYNLSQNKILDSLCGEYAILYTRKFGEAFDTSERSRIFPPDTRKDFIKVRMGQPPTGSRFCGAAHFKFLDFGMTIKAVKVSARDSEFPHKTVVEVKPYESSKSSFLLGQTVRESGSIISFGLKETVAIDRGCNQWDYFGFHFLELELATLNSEDLDDRQLIVAVKIPPEPGNVSDMSILKQPIQNTIDISILDQIRNQDSAFLYQYMAERKYMRKTMDPDWEPTELGAAGLRAKGFDPQEFEKTLLGAKDPILCVEHLYSYLDKALEQEYNAKYKHIIQDGKEYAEHRLRVMLGEQELRESELKQEDAKRAWRKERRGGVKQEGAKGKRGEVDTPSYGFKMDVGED